MKRTVAFLIIMLTAAVLYAGPAHADGTEDTVKLIVASDLHFISPEITDNGEFFTELTDNADGKVMRYSSELADAFLGEVVTAHPDALILTGDISFNGALPSHRALAEKLRAVESTGIQVLVTTGNHDVYCTSAASFSGDGYTLLKQTATEDFGEIYSDFGYSEAISRDSESLSYMYSINDSVNALVLDLNTKWQQCVIRQSTLNWIEKQLKDAAKSGKMVLAFGHQNLFQHSMFNSGYVIEQSTQLLSLFHKYNVRLYMSGHMHMQHLIDDGKTAEIASSALSVAPCQYGLLDITGDRIQYRTKQTDVSAWAVKTGKKDEQLLNFEDYAKEYLSGAMKKNCLAQLAQLGFDEDEAQLLAEYACDVNFMYFSGDLSGFDSADPDGMLLRKWRETSSMTGIYLYSVSKEAGNVSTVWESR